MNLLLTIVSIKNKNHFTTIAAMERDALQKEVLNFLAQQINQPVEEINNSEELRNLGLDSFRIIEMVLFIERISGIVIPDYAYTPGNLRSVDSIVNCAMEFKK